MADWQVSTLMLQKWLATGLLTTAALTDLTRRRIYRAWSAAALVSGVILALLDGRWQHVLIAMSLFGLTYELWSAGGIGGGDVWLASYLGLALGVDAFLAMLIGSVVGLAICVVLIMVRKLAWQDVVPLGLFWALGGLMMLLTGWQVWPA
jgi:Flp pilus assembly protein protease CpaA